MARRQKIPECKCTPCHRFNVDGPRLYEQMVEIDRRDSFREPNLLPYLKKQFVLGRGCDYCGSNRERIAFVPQIVKDFFGIEYLCWGCREDIKRIQYEEQWFICWGMTPDEEIKWLLLSLSLQRFRAEVHKLSPAQQAKDKAFQEWLESLPKFEEGPVEDLDIQIKPRFKIRPRVNGDDSQNISASAPRTD